MPPSVPSITAAAALRDWPVDRTIPEGRIEALLDQSRQTFFDTQSEPWRTKLAADLNLILGHIEYTLETSIPPVAVDVEFAEAALRIVERVANFEELRRR